MELWYWLMKSLACPAAVSEGGPWEGRVCSFRANTQEPRQRLGVQGPGPGSVEENQGQTRSGLAAG